MENMFLSIDGIEIEDLEEGDYTAYEEVILSTIPVLIRVADAVAPNAD